MFYIAMLFAHIFLGILCASTVTASYFPDFPSLPDVDDDFGDVDFGVDGDLWWFSSAEPDSEGETVATAGGERTAGDSLDSCKSFQSKNNVYFYGEILATESDVTSAEKCAIACFQAKDNYGFSCKSANFFSSPVKECDLFYDQATFSGDTDNNYPEDTVYVYDIACLGAAATTTAAAATTTTTAIPAGQTTVKPTTKPTTPRTTGTCGKADSRVDTSSQKGSLGGRIVGGVDSKPHGWPWLVSVEKAYADYPNYRKFKCGGSLIRLSDTLEKSDVVVTAEHCITEISSRYVINGGKRVPAAERRIVAGEYDLKKNDTTEVFRIAKSIHSPGTKPYKDIAIIILKEEIQFNKVIQPPCLPKSKTDLPPEKKKCVVTGGQAPKRPQEVGVPITHKGEDCANGKPDLCAGYGEGGKDSCQGDSGGPLNCELRAGKWTLSGVVSRGNGCAWAANPGFYASVAYNLDWVKKTICAESKFKGDADC